ncbi:MAG: DUF5302 domain-containing protein [Candidatus Nanopelagicales bacterium]|nr:DUF5302 domain-containing protein [Candidatus Nanopelagicales bacterium]MCU0295803.1 DUF5302 domain-containing protein [Candidatus Nanopelagicales bacterium]MCU0297586.1 DUF5302 domain-containing protein [Candidatus Nanopelagicales bacterium]
MSDNEDIKAKMREALERKKPHDPGVEHDEHRKEHGPHTETAKGGEKQFRRKAGG